MIVVCHNGSKCSFVTTTIILWNMSIVALVMQQNWNISYVSSIIRILAWFHHKKYISMWRMFNIFVLFTYVSKNKHANKDLQINQSLFFIRFQNKNKNVIFSWRLSTSTCIRKMDSLTKDRKRKFHKKIM